MQPAISINRSLDDSGLDVLHRLLARVGVQVRVDRYAVALAAISLLALGPMLQPGYFWGAHDARHSVYFLFEFDRVFRDGILYPRWFPDMTYGYGYPLFNIYGPLAFYVGEVFHLIGFDFVTSVKMVFALAWISSGLAMYGFVKRLFGDALSNVQFQFGSDVPPFTSASNRSAAFLAGLLYVFIPYHLIDVYVRAALAESVALVFLPLTLWAFYETITAASSRMSRDTNNLREDASKRIIRSVLFAAFAYAGMVFAHNGIALLFSIVLGAWIIFLFLRTNPNLHPRYFGRKGIVNLFRELVRAGLPTIGGLALGLGLTAIFMLPLVLEYKYINVAQWTQNYYNYQDHFVEFFQLFSPTWGFGISNLGPVDGLSFQIGLVPLVLSLISLFVIAKNPNHVRAYVLFFLVLSLVVIFLMFEISLPAWQAFGLASVAQFPWRLLTLTLVSFSVVGASVMLPDDEPTLKFKLQHSQFSLSAIALAALVLLGSYPYITAQNILEPKEGAVGLAGLMAFENSANEMTGTTVYAQEQPRWSPLADNYVAGRNVRTKIDFSSVPDWLFLRVTPTSLRVNGERVDYNAPNGDVTITFNVQNYPGWRAYLTPSRSTEILRELPIETEPPYGRIKVTIPQGEHGLWLRFDDTPPRTVGTILSGISLLVSIGLFVWNTRNQKNQ